jgi:hypothetical protein
MQISIIGIALVMAFGCVPFLAQTKGKGKALLGFSILDLTAVAGYEMYMHFIWEKTVHGAIRMDIFLIDLPLLVLGIATGIAGIYRASRAVGKTEPDGLPG